jgi:cyclic lactone autoinducer peptide
MPQPFIRVVGKVQENFSNILLSLVCLMITLSVEVGSNTACWVQLHASEMRCFKGMILELDVWILGQIGCGLQGCGLPSATIVVGQQNFIGIVMGCRSGLYNRCYMWMLWNYDIKRRCRVLNGK